MGFNSAVLILNDQMHDLERAPDGGKAVTDAIHSASNYRDAMPGYGRYGVRALPTQHADTAQLVRISANSIKHLGFGHWRMSDIELLKEAADKLGYRLVRKSTKETT